MTTAIAEVETAEAVEINPQHAAIKEALDGIQAIRKTRVPAEVQEAAVKPLSDHLAGLLAGYGQPVARGNTLYLVNEGTLHVVSLDPKSLLRL